METEVKKLAIIIFLETRRQVIDLYRTKYYEANFEHYTELLKKHEDISLSASSVMGILESAYILSPKATKAKRKHLKKQLKIQKASAKNQKKQISIQAKLISL